jgi:hypothetical protein
MDERRAACARKPEECASGALPRNLGTAREPGGPGLYARIPDRNHPADDFGHRGRSRCGLKLSRQSAVDTANIVPDPGDDAGR